MIIKAKYMGVCPCCNKNIFVGASVIWEKGKKPFHVECQKLEVIELMNLFFKTHKSGTLDFINKEIIDEWDVFNFKWIRKDGKEKIIQYYRNGDRYHADKPKPLIGIR